MSYRIVALVNEGRHREKIATFKYKNQAQGYLASSQWLDAVKNWPGFISVELVDTTLKPVKLKKKDKKGGGGR